MFGLTIKNGISYVRYRCKECRNEERNVRYKKNSVKYRQKAIERNHNNPHGVLYWNAFTRAKKLCIPFSIDKNDIVIPDRCPILDIPLEKSFGKMSDNSPSLDRVIPSLGYIKGNVRVISFRANRLKSDCSIDELKKILAYMESLSETPPTADSTP